MLVITKGYLLHRENYGDFDEIIIFINEYGKKFTCLSRGSRRIVSKNSYHLNYGNYLEFEIFHSEDKLSRLKKVHTLSYLAEQTKANLSLYLINEIYYQLELENKYWFELYQLLLFNILKDYNEYLIMLWLCVNIYTHEGLTINFNKCGICQTELHLKTIDFSTYHAICCNCFDSNLHIAYDSQLLTIMAQIQNQQIKLEMIKITEIKKIVPLLKGLIIFIGKNLGIFIDTVTWF